VALTILAAVIFTGVLTARADEPPKKVWSGSIALGLTATKGNSDTMLFNGAALAKRVWPKDELNLGADFTYGRQKVASGTKQTTAEAEHGFIDWKRLLNGRVYGGARVDLLHDAIADIEYRLTLSPFLGYYFIKTDVTRLSGEVGPSYIFEKLGSDSNNFLTIRFGERFEHAFNSTAKMWQAAEFLPSVEDTDKYLLNVEIGAETALTTSISVRVVAQDKYNSEPSPGRKKNDLTFITAIAYKF
jgi:putative salt-induced outer membrane protein YdiY